jgi:hypothetical protein
MPERVARIGVVNHSGHGQSDNGSPDVTPPQGDRDTAVNFSERIARATLRGNAGRHGAPAAD